METLMTKSIGILTSFLLLLSTPSVMAQNSQDTVAAVELLRMMDVDSSGKVRRAEFMRFMNDEFDKLDIDKDAELDVHELEAIHLGMKHTGGSGHR
jgi:Ca2+-binding EF-hand superfamily protein